MTIIAYERSTKRVLVDTLFTIESATKHPPVHASKVFRTAGGHQFAGCGSWPVERFAPVVDHIFEQSSDGVRGQPLIAGESFWLPDDVVIVARPSGAKYNGDIYVSWAHGNGYALLPVESIWPTKATVSWGCGSDAFNFYYAEHSDLETAFRLTCAHASGCGIREGDLLNGFDIE